MNFSHFQDECRKLAQAPAAGPDASRLRALLGLAWQQTLDNYPEMATELGYPGRDARWTDWSESSIRRRKQEPGLLQEALSSIDRRSLPPEDQLNHDLFAHRITVESGQAEFPEELLPISQMHGIQQDAARLLSMMPVRTKEQRENIFARMEALPVLVDQTVQLLSRGIAAGITPPRVSMEEIPAQVRNQVVADPQQAPVLAGFAKLPSGLSKSQAEKIRTEAAARYRKYVVPAFEKLAAYLESEYLPGCRESTAWVDLPQGREWYEFNVRRHTTTDLTPDEIFDIGQSEVARLRGEMDRVIKESGFSGDFSAFCEFLRTDDRFFFSTPDELLRAYRDIAKRVDPELVRLFGKLPRLTYGVVPIPSYAEKSQTTAYYQPGSPQAGRPGYFYANTYDLSSRPKWEMEALTLHEAVPGHHLQIALSQEMEHLPEFRREEWMTAFGEGWALYAESLGEEMGFFADPYSKFGQLTYEMWRAIRLVVDPGLHWKGWSREQAIQFFLDNSSKTRHDVKVEVERYIVWPGQALAYKVGELKIRELRTYAEERLGDRFDLRSFHDYLLGESYLPLTMLQERMSAWVDDLSGASGLTDQ